MMKNLREHMERIFDRVSDIVGRKSYLYSEFHLSIMMVFWGVWVWLPNGTFETAAGFASMGDFASAFAWGFIAVALGISRIKFLLHGHRISLSILTLMSGWFWLFVGLSFLLGDVSNTGFVTYTGIGLYEFWMYRALLVDRR